MVKPVFSGTAWVEIQGDRVLRFIDLNRDCAEYRVIGFDDPIKVGLKAISQVLETKRLNGFAGQFNAPAQIEISKPDSSGLVIELRETSDPDPGHRLWIAIGIQGSVPVYDYLFDCLAPFGDRFAFLAVFRRGSGFEASPSALPVVI